MCGRVRLSSDYSEIKIKLKFDGPPPNVCIRRQSRHCNPNSTVSNSDPAWAFGHDKAQATLRSILLNYKH